MNFNIVNFGAVPGVDCRPAIQAAIDAASAHPSGGVVELPAGDWMVTRAPPGSYNRFAALSIHGKNVAIRGAGKLLTRLLMVGDAGLSTFFGISLDPGADNVTISDLTIDSTQLYNTEEQTHAIAIGTAVVPPGVQALVSNVEVSNVAFVHVGQPGFRKGDCIRVAGNTPGTAAVNIRLTNLDFLSSSRSGVAMQRNVNGLTIANCYFDGDHIGDTPIDGEATGGDWDKGLVVSGCTIVKTAPGGNNFNIALTNQSHFTVTGNVLIGRGISLVRGTDGVIANNVLDCTDMLTVGCIDVANVTRDVVISGNTVRRRGVNGQCIRLNPHSGVCPAELVVSGNTITNDTDGAAIYAHSVGDLLITGNKIRGSGGPASTGILVEAGLRAVDGLVVADNLIRGCTYAGVRLVSYPGKGFVGSQVVGNVTRATGPGLRCDNASNIPAGGLVVANNNWSTPGFQP